MNGGAWALALLLLSGGASACGAAPRPPTDESARPVALYVAASLAGAFAAALDAAPAAHGAGDAGGARASRPQVAARLIAASSATLARQLARGAPPGIFVSANKAWMTYLEGRGRIQPGSRAALLGNRLMVVRGAVAAGLADNHESGESAHTRLPEWNGPGLRRLIRSRLQNRRRLCLGDPDHVPLGMYARTALRRSAVWEYVADRLVPGADARRTVWYLTRGACGLGIVYRTDVVAAGNEGILPLGLIQETLHEPIVYEIASIRGAGAEARDLYDFFFSPAARDVFQRFGFVSLR